MDFELLGQIQFFPLEDIALTVAVCYKDSTLVYSKLLMIMFHHAGQATM
jgi:hypothetical protein